MPISLIMGYRNEQWSTMVGFVGCLSLGLLYSETERWKVQITPLLSRFYKSSGKASFTHWLVKLAASLDDRGKVGCKIAAARLVVCNCRVYRGIFWAMVNRGWTRESLHAECKAWLRVVTREMSSKVWYWCSYWPYVKHFTGPSRAKEHAVSATMPLSSQSHSNNAGIHLPLKSLVAENGAPLG